MDGTLECPAAGALRAFRLRGLMPEWEFNFGEFALRKKMVLLHGQNTLFIAYEHLRGAPVSLATRPEMVPL